MIFLRKNKKLKRESDFLEAEEILFNKEALAKVSEFEEIQKLEISVGRWGLDLISFFGIFIFIMAFSIVLFLNTVHGNELKLSAQRNAIASIPIIADRGLIFDRFDKSLVYNQEVFDLVFFPNYLPIEKEKREEVLNKIYQNSEIKNLFSEENLIENFDFLEPFVLKSNLTREEAIQFESYFAGYPVIQVVRQNLRQYQSSLAFSHLLGYTGRVSKEDIEKNPQYQNFSKIGKNGLEAFYEDYLRGEDGEIKILRNAAMEILEQSANKEPERGNNLKLTIDGELQEYSYKRLSQQIKNIGKERGGIVLITNPQTGEILTLVSYPGYDINLFSKGIDQREFELLMNSPLKPLFNRVVSGLYNPGSTIKPIMAISALQEKVIDPFEKIETHGYISIPNPYFPDKPSIFVDWRNNGYVDMQDAIARSSNVYFYIIGGGYDKYQGLGIQRIKEYLEKFNFNQISGIDLPAEKIGNIPDEKSKKIWRIGDTYNVSIGQGDLTTTPIRLITALNSLINGGKILKPYLVSEIIDNNQRIIFKNQPQIIQENFLDSENLKIVKDGMKKTVTSPLGTAYTLNDLPFSVGGKSGSAQTFGNTKINALFFSFAPAENPKISLLVLIEDVPEGSLNAIPVAKDILLWYYKNRGL